MKKILLIATGGTIASKPTKSGLAPAISSEELLKSVPSIADICDVSAIQLMSIDSSNMDPNCWLKLVKCIEEEYDNYDGFVIAHGTDTLAYTAAALSYLIQNSRKPIVITGAQKSIYLEDTDARRNLIDSFRYASDDRACGVHVVFDSKIIVGTRARKIRTHSFNAFESVDFPKIGVIFNDKVVYYIEEKIEGEVKFAHVLNRNVNIIKLVPGINPDIFDYVGDASDVLIIEGFGVGGLPCYDEENTLMKKVRRLKEEGKIIVLSTSVPHEGSDVEVYQVGNEIKGELKVLENYNMTQEATVAKMMWITAITKDPAEVEKLFYTPISYDVIY